MDMQVFICCVHVRLSKPIYHKCTMHIHVWCPTLKACFRPFKIICVTLNISELVHILEAERAPIYIITYNRSFLCLNSYVQS